MKQKHSIGYGIALAWVSIRARDRDAEKAKEERGRHASDCVHDDENEAEPFCDNGTYFGFR